MNRPRKVTYRAGLFEPVNLLTPSKLDAALHEFAGVINQANYVEALKGLFDKNNVLELVLSGINEGIALNDWILQEFPTEPKGFEKSFVYELLVKLSNFFLFYSSSADVETASLLRGHHQYVQLASEIISTLSTTTYLEDDNQQGDSASSPINTKGKSSQKERKLAKKAARAWENIDARLFMTINVAIPKSRADADQLCGKLCSRMGTILEVFLNGIRRPDVRDAIRASFIPQERREDLTIVTDSDVPVNDDDPIPPAPTEDETPSVFPMIHLTKAGLFFDSPDDFGGWPILLSSQINNDLRSHRKDGKVYDIIMNKIRELSRGLFSADNHKRLTGLKSDVPVFEAKVLKDLRLVYIIDCITHNDNSSEVQALRLFGVYTHAQMDNRLWHLVSNYLSSRSKEYRSRCLARQPHPNGGNIFLPRSFPESPEISHVDAPVDSLSTLAVDDENKLHHVISLEKYVMLSKELLESIEAGREVNFPFEVSKQERTIIQHPHSCYVLGRSGTGKTITMLFKILLVERDYQLSDKIRAHPRQMFVTKSRKLVGKVEELFITYFSSLSFASHMEENSYSRRTDARSSAEENIFNEDDDPTWQNSFPERFSDLEEKHFPLFITFDHLCTMIEADIKHSLCEETSHSNFSMTAGSSASTRARARARAKREGQFITFDRFVAEYWPHLPQHLSKDFRALLVFNEIMGVISGSEGAILTSNGYLDREAYKKSTRTQPAFAGDAVYDLFLSYLKRKRKLGDSDPADRTRAIIRFIAKKPVQLQKISHLYVDETQDNLLIDALLLRMLCSNADGLFWAGDTAQTISAGSSFRFNDLKAFLYRVQRKPSDAHVSFVRPKEPVMFYLTINYRSHAGIVDCAHSVIEIITRYWRNTIDSLPREKGNSSGAKPIFYSDLSSEFVEEGHFLSRDLNKHGKIEMGAHQCILVRDERAKEKLSRKIRQATGGKTALVITLYDSKGQEFNDVLLYNFFHDSVVNASQWRLVLHEICSPAPAFKELQHAALCLELKSLYVAITRARNNLRIADESLKGEPMRALWQSRNQIFTCRPGQEPTDFAKPTNRDEWVKRAKLFFDNGQWLLAQQCYETGGKNQSAAVAEGYYQREEARRIPTGEQKTRKLAFASAAETFSFCAGNTNVVDDKNKYLKLSAECYEEGGNTLCAAETYRAGNWLAQATSLYRKLGKFGDIYDIITQPGIPLEAVPESIRDVTRLYYVSNEEYEKAHHLFESVEEEIEYLEDRNLDLAQLHLLLLHNRRIEAAELHLSEGRTLQAIDLFLGDDADRLTSMSKAKDSILRSLWKLSPFGVVPVNQAKIRQLLDRSNRVPQSVMNDNDLDEVTMFRLIISSDHTQLSKLGNSFLKRRNVNAAVLCLDHYFNQTPQLLDEDIANTMRDLQQFYDYVRILYDLAFQVDPIKDPLVQKLFGIQASENGTIALSPRNLLSASIRADLSDGKVVLDNEKFLEIFRGCMRSRLLDRVRRENDTCLKSPALHRPFCLKHLIYQNCKSSPCERAHISPDASWFQAWISAHLLQILIYHSISSIVPTEREDQRRFWLIKLYEALNPSYHIFGSTSNMLNSVVTSFPDAVYVLKEWVRTVSFSLDFYPDHLFLTLAMLTADFAFTFDMKEAETYMYRAKFAISQCPLQYIRKPQFNNTLHEMLGSFNQKSPTSLLGGISFICNVMERKIPINIHIFCTFIERICGLLVVCDRLRLNNNLHCLMLPRSWLKTIVDRIDIDQAKLQNSSRFWLLLQPLEALLKSLSFSRYPDKFQFKIGPDFSPLGRQGLTQRGPFIARICRVLGLLACNIRVDRFHEKILAIFASIRNKEMNSRLYAGYFYAGNFQDIRKTTRRSMQGSAFDDMVQLFHASRVPKELYEVFAVRKIVYSTDKELSSLLEATSHTSTSPFVPDHWTSDSLVHTEREVTIPANELDYEQLDPDLDIDVPRVVPEDQESTTDIEISREVYTGHSEKDVRAASIIKRVYLEYLERKRILAGVGQMSSTRRWFMLCKKALRPDMQAKFCPGYAIWYLGPLPHLLATLEAIQPILIKERKALRKRLFPIMHHEDLDEVNAHSTLISKAIKSLKLHQQQLEPNSALHREHNIGRLKQQVKEVFDIIQGVQLLLDLPEDVRGSLSIAFKAILQESKPRTANPHQNKKARHPALVVEDLHDLIQDGHEDS